MNISENKTNENKTSSTVNNKMYHKSMFNNLQRNENLSELFLFQADFTLEIYHSGLTGPNT